MKAGIPFGLNIRKIGIIARDYNIRFPNGYRDFSYALPEILALLHENGCDAALFSLFSIIPRQGYDPLSSLPDYANLKMICLEEFHDAQAGRKAGQYVVYCRATDGWKEHRFKQAFGRVNWQAQQKQVEDFARTRIPERIFGPCCILICGETNGVKYDRSGAKNILDPCGVRAAIPPHVQVILNPVHDRMNRFEIMMKRRFLSEGGRWVISVWNRGKRDKNGKARDGGNPPWTVFYDGEAVHIAKLKNSLNIEVGYLEIASIS